MKNQNSILLLFEPKSQIPLVQSLIINMRGRGIIIDAWNATIWKFIDGNHDRNAKYLVFPILRLFIKIPKAGTFIHRLLNYFVMKNMAAKYDAIDIHFFTPTYFRLLDYLIRANKAYKITIWGSDFYRANQQLREKQKKYYEKAAIIQIGTEQMRDDFFESFPDVRNKVRIANFGIFQFDFIDQYRNKNQCSFLPVDAFNNKTVITCGYNGSKGQQHEIIIKAIERLRKDQKDKIVLFFPMTYGTQKKYKNTIQDLLSHLEVPYYIFSSYLSNEENARLRVLTDIVVNIQITDALSGSLQEHLYAGNLLLAGDWLPYRIYDEIGVFYQKISLENLSENLSFCIDNLDTLKEKTQGNALKIKNLSSWEIASPKWERIYTKLLTEC